MTGGTEGRGGDQQPPQSRLRRVAGPIDGSPAPPPIRLVREWKGLTVADLLRDEIVDRLPGQARSALHHLERGDYAAADHSLPGEWKPVLPGPGTELPRRRAAVALVIIAAVLLAAVAALYLGD